MDALVIVIAVFFLGMGLVALAMPERISAIFGQTLTADGRNEVRAVYGGFGVAIAAVLMIAASRPGLRVGVFTAVACALAGMAGGRLVSAAVERPRSFYPAWFYFTAEAVMAAVLFGAAG
jgi:hypothetical protein